MYFNRESVGLFNVYGINVCWDNYAMDVIVVFIFFHFSVFSSSSSSSFEEFFERIILLSFLFLGAIITSYALFAATWI